jgi:hypothetical protein
MENIVTNGIYTILDLSAKMTGPIFEAMNDTVAIKSVESKLKNYGSDFQLLKLGKCIHDDDGQTIIEVFENEEITKSFDSNDKLQRT